MPVCSQLQRSFCDSKQGMKTRNALREGGSVQTIYILNVMGLTQCCIFSPTVVKTVTTCLNKRQFYDNFSCLLKSLKW